MTDTKEEAKWVDVLTVHDKHTLPTVIQLVSTVTKAMEIVYGTGNVIIDFEHNELRIARKELPEETDKRVQEALKSAQRSIEYEARQRKVEVQKAEELGMELDEYLKLQKKIRGY